eukprot:TRINITY_DN7205_c0_g1_i1.p1 TRINITY_DN7205_c0_g1~~TRINITY_DN7205_c0_g1_i1.p1  ORF type:complete len:237 (+),score=43.26 TRINITY_DN7205_c0_g1_i1:32-712(+)
MGHQLKEGISVWPGSVTFSRCPRTAVPADGYKTEAYTFECGNGTHIDSPSHFFANGRTISDLTLEELIAPVVVVDVRRQCQEDCDYQMSLQDIKSWEEQHGDIPPRALVCMYTGWGARYHDADLYLNKCDPDHPDVMHFPGFSAEVATYLTQSRSVVGLAIDTLSVDAGNSTDFPVHAVMLQHDKYHIENMKLDELPAHGAVTFSFPLFVQAAPEAPARVVALVPK